MNALSISEVKRLATTPARICVSIYLPTHRTGSDVPEAQLHLRNMLRDAEAQLLAQGERAGEVEALLQPAHALLADSFFWRHLGDGLALFLAPELAQHFRLPLAFEPKLVLARRFYLRPLLPVLEDAGQFYILALSQKSVRLLRGTRAEVSEIQLSSLPHNLAEALRYDAWEKEIRVRSGAPVGAGRWSAIFYGSGGDETHKEELLQYCQRIDRAVHEWLACEQTPLVLAGVEYVLSLYRSVSTYPHLAEGEIVGNPDRLSAEALRSEAWRILAPRTQQRQTEALATYERWSGTPRTAHDLRRIVYAAHQGQVQTLFVARGCEQWGIFDPKSQAIHLFDAPNLKADELLDLAAVQTWLHHGVVYTLLPIQMPADAPLAAVLRY